MNLLIPLVLRLLSLLLLAVLTGPTALAQACTTEWATPVDGSWSDATKWTNGAPGTDSGGLSPCITVAGTYAVSYDVGVFGSRTVETFVLGGASGTQTLTLFSGLSVTDASIRPNGVLVPVGNVGNSQGLYATGTVTLEGVVDYGSGSFLRSGGTLDIAPSGTLRLGGQTRAGATSGLFRVRGTIEGIGCPVPNTGECLIDAPLEVLGGTLRATGGVLRATAGGTMNDATLDAGPTGFLTLNADAAGPPYAMTVEGVIQGTPQGQVGMSGLNLYAGPAGATLAVNGTGFQMFGTSILRSAGGSFTNTGLLLKAATGSNFSGLAEVIVRNEGVVEIPSSLGLYAGSVLRNEPGGIVRATAAGRLSGDGNGTGRFENAGLFVLDAPGQSFTFSDGGFGNNSGPYNQPGSEMRVLAGTLDLTGPGSRTLPVGATLSGAGAISVPGTFEPEGTVSPGTPEQPLARLVHGWYYRPTAISGSPRLVIDVDTDGRSDTLYVSSGFGPTGAQLAGTLVVRVRPGYVPTVGDEFLILRAEGTVTGQFAQVAVAGSPAGIAFVPETVDLPSGQGVRLRVAAVAPGGPVTVSTTAPVGGGDRTLFFNGPGAPGVSAARLDCTDCLDAASFGSLPARIVRANGLNEALFDLTSPRAIGLYDLVFQRPGQPDERIPVLVRPFVSAVEAVNLVQLGMMVRPETAPGRIHNFSPYVLRNVTNGPSGAAPFVTIDRPKPSRVGMIVSSSHTGEGSDTRTYDSAATTEPLAVPIFASTVPSNGETSFEVGLRIDPEAVLFPGQTPTGPEDERFPFGEGQHLFLTTTSNTSFERGARTAEAGLRATSNPTLNAYLVSVDAADASAVAAAVRSAMQPSASVRSLAGTESLLAQVLDRLDDTVPAPPGLAADAEADFTDALRVAIEVLTQSNLTAYDDALTGSPAVQALYPDELAALGIEYIEPMSGSSQIARSNLDRMSRPPISDLCFNQIGNPDAIRKSCSCDERRALGNAGTGYSEDCPPSNPSEDPNDKLADTNLICEFGTVTVDGEEETRCVRYFVPRSRATEPVAYTITFENKAEALAAAEYVTITDEIDPNLDLSSLRVESTSSDSTFSYSVSGRTITFRFVGIDLPPNVTAPEGEGFVRFTIRPVGGLPDGTEIRNDADIVFDFNPPIATPEVVHEIRTVSDLGTFIAAPDFVGTGEPLALDVVVANLRGDPAEAATVTIQTGGLTGITATPTVGTCSGTGPIVCDFGRLDPETFEQVTLTTSTAPLGQYTISATARTTAVDGFAANDTDLVAVGITPTADERDPDALREPTLALPRPNPSAGEATLRWGLPTAGRADVRVFDLLGREVAVLVDDAAVAAGWHETRFRESVASGVYVVRFVAEVGGQTTVRTRRMVVVR